MVGKVIYKMVSFCIEVLLYGRVWCQVDFIMCFGWGAGSCLPDNAGAGLALPALDSGISICAGLTL